jgi:hypothetical protein
MKGLAVAEGYYRDCGAPMISQHFSAFADRIAVGFVGPGSECFGFDDELSRDHDWGPGFCIWLTSEDHGRIGRALQEEYDKLPGTYRGFGPRIASPGEEGRVGVSTIKGFYTTYTGLDHPPESLGEWLHIPEQSLAVCTNGRVFRDARGEFTRWRNHLMGFYPEDIRLKKIASRCITIAQSGQYNFERSIKRGETFAVHYAEIKFCSDVISLLFLLNRRFAPFYKWMHRAMIDLPLLGRQMHTLILELISENTVEMKKQVIDRICALLVDELRREKLSDSQSDFLLDHAHIIHSRIQDETLRARFAVIN